MMVKEKENENENNNYNAEYDVSQFEMFTTAMRSEFQHSCGGAGGGTRAGGGGFTSARNLSLMMGSWNVNAKEEESHLLSQWLSPNDVLNSDLVVIGLQELIALSASNTVIGSTNTLTGSSDNSSSISYNSCEKWLSKLLAHLNQDPSSSATASANASTSSVDSYSSEEKKEEKEREREEEEEEEEGQEQEQGDEDPSKSKSSSSGDRSFSLLSQLSMVGLSIFVFVRADILSRVRGVQARSIARGGGGLLGNKGAVCVRLEVDDTSFCFCSAHLCAHREDVLKRNEDFRLIYNTPVQYRTVPLQAFLHTLHTYHCLTTSACISILLYVLCIHNTNS